jgi:hypothetical protein
VSGRLHDDERYVTLSYSIFPFAYPLLFHYLLLSIFCLVFLSFVSCRCDGVFLYCISWTFTGVSLIVSLTRLSLGLSLIPNARLSLPWNRIYLLGASRLCILSVRRRCVPKVFGLHVVYAVGSW